MGVDINIYTVWGVRVPEYNEDFVVAYERKYGYTVPPRTTAIFDGMGGEYMVLGYILFNGGNIRYGEFNETFMQQDISALPALEENYRKKFFEDFPDFAQLLNEPFQILSFVYFH